MMLGPYRTLRFEDGTTMRYAVGYYHLRRGILPPNDGQPYNVDEPDGTVALYTFEPGLGYLKTFSEPKTRALA